MKLLTLFWVTISTATAAADNDVFVTVVVGGGGGGGGGADCIIVAEGDNEAAGHYRSMAIITGRFILPLSGGGRGFGFNLQTNKPQSMEVCNRRFHTRFNQNSRDHRNRKKKCKDGRVSQNARRFSPCGTK